MHNLARLSIPVRIVLSRLKLPEHFQSCPCKLRVNEGILQRHDKTIPAKRRYKPWQPGRGYEFHVVGLCNRQAQGRHIFYSLVVEAVELLIAGADLSHPRLPIVKDLCKLRSGVLVDA